jgi:hypothetical protein
VWRLRRFAAHHVVPGDADYHALAIATAHSTADRSQATASQGRHR